MRNDGNLWALALETPPGESTDDVFALMDRQCRDLEEATGGRVKGRFAEITRIPSGLTLATLEMASAVEKAAMTASSWYQDAGESALPQKDAGRLYDKRTYGFDVYSDRYRFRPFDLTFGPVYPVTLLVDETIWRESFDEFSQWLPIDGTGRDAHRLELSNGDELRSCVSIIIRSRKMNYVLRRLIDDGTSDAEGAAEG